MDKSEASLAGGCFPWQELTATGLLFPSHPVLIHCAGNCSTVPQRCPLETSRKSEETQINQKQGLFIYLLSNSPIHVPANGWRVNYTPHRLLVKTILTFYRKKKKKVFLFLNKVPRHLETWKTFTCWTFCALFNVSNAPSLLLPLWGGPFCSYTEALVLYHCIVW